jgi:hypothetical protein
VDIEWVQWSPQERFEVACVKEATEVTDRPSREPAKAHFVVKVQRLLNVKSILSINSEDMTVCGRLLPTKNPELNPILECQAVLCIRICNWKFWIRNWDTTSTKLILKFCNLINLIS